MPMEKAKCPKCRKNARRTGITKEGGKIIKHMICGTCGHRFKVKLT
jgi:transcription elongation factor Elf1